MEEELRRANLKIESLELRLEVLEGKRESEMRRVATRYYELLENMQQLCKADKDELQALNVRLQQLTAPFSDNIAYCAFLEMERISAVLKLK